nr:MAG TPA: hypothetical protein [Caudoviricetes sp.]
MVCYGEEEEYFKYSLRFLVMKLKLIIVNSSHINNTYRIFYRYYLYGIFFYCFNNYY